MGRSREERRAAQALRRRCREERKCVVVGESLGLQLLPRQIDSLFAYAARGGGWKR